MTAAHFHACEAWAATGDCDPPCRCACGAVLKMAPDFQEDPRWAWCLPDGSWEPFPGPDPDEVRDAS